MILLDSNCEEYSKNTSASGAQLPSAFPLAADDVENSSGKSANREFYTSREF